MSDSEIKSGFHPQFDIDLRYGKECESLVLKMLEGRHEVKSDRKALETGNLFIEFLSHGHPSSIQLTEADYWTFHLNDNLFLIVRTEELKKLCEDCKQAGGGNDKDKANKGYLLPLKKIFGW